MTTIPHQLATRVRRCELSTPGSSPKMLAKAAQSDADLVFLDLEDAVAPSEKAAARQHIIQALNGLDWGHKTRAVRINSLDTQYAHQDIIEIVEGAGANLDVIIIPKVRAGRDVWWVDCLLTQLETRLGLTNKIGLEVLIEEVEGVMNVDEIAHASDRLQALILGTGDLAASQGVASDAIGGSSSTYPGDIWHYARVRVVMAARSAGLQAIDGPFAAFKDSEGYRRECERSAVLGFVGKWAIHPSQIEIANDVFSPTIEQVERARMLTKAYEKAESEGLGAVAIDGDMVDAASIRILRNTIVRAELIGM